LKSIGEQFAVGAREKLKNGLKRANLLLPGGEGGGEGQIRSDTYTLIYLKQITQGPTA